MFFILPHACSLLCDPAVDQKEVIIMTNKELLEREAEYLDELHYLQNILEYQEETGKSLEEIIQDRIEDIYNELDSIAINK